MVNSLVWLIAGAVIGWLATLVMRRRHPSLLINMIVGSFGALLAGYWMSPLFHNGSIWKSGNFTVFNGASRPIQIKHR